jgi:hypothetical protein
MRYSPNRKIRKLNNIMRYSPNRKSRKLNNLMRYSPYRKSRQLNNVKVFRNITTKMPKQDSQHRLRLPISEGGEL